MWARVDDGWWCHPKVMVPSLPACGLWISALSWACGQGVDEVPDAFLPVVGAEAKHADELHVAGLWEPTSTGWRIIEWETIAPPTRRRHIPLSVRRVVYERDGFQCVACGSPDDLSLDHVIAYSLGGPDTVENLQTMCRPCNSRKGTG